MAGAYGYSALRIGSVSRDIRVEVEQLKQMQCDCSRETLSNSFEH